MEPKVFTNTFKEAVLTALVQDLKFLKEASTCLKPHYLSQQLYVLATECIFKIFRETGGKCSRAGLLNDLVNELIKANKTDKDNTQINSTALAPAQELIDRIFKPIESPLDDVKADFLDYCRTKEIQTTVGEVYKKLDSGQIDHNQVMSEVRGAYLRCNAAQDKGISFFDEIENLPSDINRLRSKLFTLGLPKMDKAMGGGITPGTLTTIIGAPKGGKSMWLVNVAYHNMLRGYNVVVFTLEISDIKWRNRVASRISGVSMDQLSEKSDLVIEQVKKFRRNHNSQLAIKYYPTATVDQLRGYLYYLEGTSGKKPDIVIVDYGDLLRSGKRDQEERFIQKDVFTDLRIIGTEFDVAVITASACNRQAIDKPVIKMKDIAEDINKVRISDHIYSICQTDQEYNDNQFRAFFAGSREADAGKISKVRFDWSKCWMKEVDEKEEKSDNKLEF